jgi:hypothetical protein
MMNQEGAVPQRPPIFREKYIKIADVFAIICQKVLAICAKRVYTRSAIL